MTLAGPLGDVSCRAVRVQPRAATDHWGVRLSETPRALYFIISYYITLCYYIQLYYILYSPPGAIYVALWCTRARPARTVRPFERLTVLSDM